MRSRNGWRHITEVGGRPSAATLKGANPHGARVASGRYYEDHLSGERLRRCYEIAPPRIRRYLDAEVAFVRESVRGFNRVLELGCGYGRALRDIAPVVSHAVGCDTSRASLRLARAFLGPRDETELVRADAARLSFASGTFDAVACIQNGISAFGVDRRRLVSEAVRVARSGGLLLFSTYSPRIWNERLEWFRLQAREGLIGPIDEPRTRAGTIVCTDGFRATTVGGREFTALFEGIGLLPELREVDGSSVFCLAIR